MTRSQLTRSELTRSKLTRPELTRSELTRAQLTRPAKAVSRVRIRNPERSVLTSPHRNNATEVNYMNFTWIATIRYVVETRRLCRERARAYARVSKLAAIDAAHRDKERNARCERMARASALGVQR